MTNFLKKCCLFIFLNFMIINCLEANNKESKLNEVPKDKWIAIDKVQHFGYSLLVSLGCQYLLVNNFHPNQLQILKSVSLYLI